MQGVLASREALNLARHMRESVDPSEHAQAWILLSMSRCSCATSFTAMHACINRHMRMPASTDSYPLPPVCNKAALARLSNGVYGGFRVRS